MGQIYCVVSRGRLVSKLRVEVEDLEGGVCE